MHYNLTVTEKISKCHCEERFLRRGNLEVIDILRTEIASLRSQRRLKHFFSKLLRKKSICECPHERNDGVLLCIRHAKVAHEAAVHGLWYFRRRPAGCPEPRIEIPERRITGNEDVAGIVKVHDLFQGLQDAVVHVGEGQRYIAQMGRFELSVLPGVVQEPAEPPVDGDRIQQGEGILPVRRQSDVVEMESREYCLTSIVVMTVGALAAA